MKINKKLLVITTMIIFLPVVIGFFDGKVIDSTVDGIYN